MLLSTLHQQRCRPRLVQDVVKDRVGSWLGMYYMVTAFGRFAGPLVIGAVTRMAIPDGRMQARHVALPEVVVP